MSRPAHPIRHLPVNIALLVDMPQLRAHTKPGLTKSRINPPTIRVEVLSHDSAPCFLVIKNSGTASSCVPTENATNRGIETS